jgi:TPR repeat protein
MPQKLSRMLPKWAMFAVLVGGLSAFIAAFMLFMHNVFLALPFMLLTGVLYLVGVIGYALAPRREPQAQEPGSQGALAKRSPILAGRGYLIAFVIVACVIVSGWKAVVALKALAPAPTLVPVTITDDIALEGADNEFEQGEYQNALKSFEPLATKGNGHAQVMLAQIYLGQTGVPRDVARALQWVQKAVAQNYPQGLILLSIMYLKGDGVPEDPVQGLALIRRAVALDSAEAKLQLGMMFLQGLGVKKDPLEARNWVMASARQGLFGAQVVLGRLVLNEGTRLGANLPVGGDPSAAAKHAPVSSAVRKAAEAGDAEAQLTLGRALYAKALVVGGDVVEAQPWVEKSAISGNAMANFAAGALYVDGTHGVPYDANQAHTWFDKGMAQLH